MPEKMDWGDFFSLLPHEFVKVPWESSLAGLSQNILLVVKVVKKWPLARLLCGGHLRNGRDAVSGHAVWNEVARESGQPCVSDIEFGKEKRYYLLLVRLSISKCDWVMKAVRPQWPSCFAATAGLAASRHRVLREFVSGQWRHKSSIQHCRVRLGPLPLSASLTGCAGWRHNCSGILMLMMITV